MQGPGELRQQSRALFFRRSLWKKIVFLFVTFSLTRQRKSKDNAGHITQTRTQKGFSTLIQQHQKPSSHPSAGLRLTRPLFSYYLYARSAPPFLYRIRKIIRSLDQGSSVCGYLFPAPGKPFKQDIHKAIAISFPLLNFTFQKH